MAVQLTMEGNLRARTRSVAPTGEKHRTTFGQLNDFILLYLRSVICGNFYFTNELCRVDDTLVSLIWQNVRKEKLFPFKPQ